MHAQTRRGLTVAVGFVVAAVVAAVAGVGPGWWVPLHLFVVGGLLSAISATTQMLAVTWATAPAPRPLVAGIQRWALAGGAVALVVGRQQDQTWLFTTGGVTVVLAVLALAPILIHVRNHAVTDRFSPALEAYAAAIVAGALGMSIGLLLGSGRSSDRVLELRQVHLVLNVFGLVGLIAAATLPYFAATQVRAKMSSRATPAAMRATFAGLALAVAVAATGRFLDRTGVFGAGLILYAVGLVAIAALLPVYGRGRLRWAGPRALQLLSGLAWWAAMALMLGVAAIRGTDDRAILQALVIGGYAQILVASLAYLGPVLRGGGHKRLTRGFALTRSWVSLAAGNAAALAAVFDQPEVLAAVLVVWLLDVAVRAVRLLVGTEGPDTPGSDGPPGAPDPSGTDIAV